MAKINRFVCATEFANTGIGDCPIVPKHIVGAFIVPKDFEITAADAVTLKTFLEDKAAATLQKERILPLHNFVGVEDGSEDLVETTLGYGGISVTREGNYNFTYQIGQGGLCLQKALRKFNNRPVRVLLYDANGMLFGMKSENVVKGIPVELFYAMPMKLSDGSAETAFHVRLVIKPAYLNENLSYIATAPDGFMLQEIEGLMDVQLEVASRTASAIQVKGFAGCGTINVLKDYATEFNEGVTPEARWSLLDPSTGTAITPTSISVNTEGVATITLASDVDVIINLASSAVLATDGIIGFEGKPVLSLKTI